VKLKGFGTNLGKKKEEGELGNGNEGENVVAMMKKVHCGCRMRVHGKTRFCECETCLFGFDSMRRSEE